MSEDTPQPQKQTPVQPSTSELPEAAKRALAEAEARRQTTPPIDRPAELGGRDGLDPVRFGDWEKKGIAIDF